MVCHDTAPLRLRVWLDFFQRLRTAPHLRSRFRHLLGRMRLPSDASVAASCRPTRTTACFLFWIFCLNRRKYPRTTDLFWHSCLDQRVCPMVCALWFHCPIPQMNPIGRSCPFWRFYRNQRVCPMVCALWFHCPIPQMNPIGRSCPFWCLCRSQSLGSHPAYLFCSS